MYFESIDNVMTADGYIGIVNFTFMHDDYINSNVRQGAIIKKGEYFADEGGFGSGRVGKFSGHVHIEAGKGKSPASQKQNAQGTWCTPGQEHLYNIFFVSPNTKITGAGGYNWKRTPSSDPVPPNPVAPPQEGEIMTGNLLYLNNSRNNQIFVEPNPESTILGERDQVKPGAYVIIEAPTAGTPVADTKWAKIWYNNAVGYAVYGGMVQGGAYIMEHTDVKSMYGSPIAQSILPEVDNSATIALLQTAIEQLK
jgi:hypothetical protein